jgi:nicotinate dehydrogenase subunit A
MSLFNITVNSKRQAIEAAPEVPLLYILRDDLRLNGPRFGCGLGQCGACTVLVGGAAVRSCVTPISTVGKLEVVTLEGLGTPQDLHPLQKAFIDEQAVQCGYCISGVMMQAAALLKTNPDPDEGQIREALADNLCRCGTHTRIVKAVSRAAKAMR